MKKIISAILAPVNKIPADKLKHSFLGILFTLLFIPVILLKWHPVIAYGACLGIAGGYELYQGFTKSGKMEIVDFFYTVLSPTIVFIITLLYAA